jgi:hypothetical protein
LRAADIIIGHVGVPFTLRRTGTPNIPLEANTLLAKCIVSRSGDVEPRFLPVQINRRSQPEIVGHDARGEAVLQYVERITRAAGLSTRFVCDRDEVVVVAES